MNGYLKAAFASLLLSTSPLSAQTILSGDHLVEGHLQLGSGVTSGGLKILGETGALATPVLISSGDGGVLFTGNEGVGEIPLEGAGTRFMWYSGKAALRVGTIDSNWWDDASIGLNSVAFSYSKAGAPLSIAAIEAVASGERSVAIGQGVEARAYKSFVIGTFNSLTGTEDAGDWVDTDPLFVIGNGTGDPLDAPAVQHRNAFVVQKNGDVIMTGKVYMPPQGDILMGEFGD